MVRKMPQRRKWQPTPVFLPEKIPWAKDPGGTAVLVVVKELDPLEKDMATHSSILAWRLPWTEKPGGLQSTGSQRVGHD